MAAHPQASSSGRHAPTPVQRLSNRWKHPEVFRKGWVPVPVTLLEHTQDLLPGIALTPPLLVFLLHLVSHKWDEKMPYPGYRRIAERMGVSVKMARKYAKELEEKGFLKRESRQGDTNIFNLDPLFDLLLTATTRGAMTPTVEQAKPPVKAKSGVAMAIAKAKARAKVTATLRGDRPTSKRESIGAGSTEKRYVKRLADGSFEESREVGRSAKPTATGSAKATERKGVFR